jgi:hypothetical protein
MTVFTFFLRLMANFRRNGIISYYIHQDEAPIQFNNCTSKTRQFGNSIYKLAYYPGVFNGFRFTPTHPTTDGKAFQEMKADYSDYDLIRGCLNALSPTCIPCEVMPGGVSDEMIEAFVQKQEVLHNFNYDRERMFNHFSSWLLKDQYPKWLSWSQMGAVIVEIVRKENDQKFQSTDAPELITTNGAVCKYIIRVCKLDELGNARCFNLNKDGGEQGLQFMGEILKKNVFEILTQVRVRPFVSASDMNNSVHELLQIWPTNQFVNGDSSSQSYRWTILQQVKDFVSSDDLRELIRLMDITFRMAKKIQPPGSRARLITKQIQSKQISGLKRPRSISSEPNHRKLPPMARNSCELSVVEASSLDEETTSPCCSMLDSDELSHHINHGKRVRVGIVKFSVAPDHKWYSKCNAKIVIIDGKERKYDFWPAVQYSNCLRGLNRWKDQLIEFEREFKANVDFIDEWPNENDFSESDLDRFVCDRQVRKNFDSHLAILSSMEQWLPSKFGNWLSRRKELAKAIDGSEQVD